MSQPLVSIIMGAYNCSSFVKNSINSVLKQTYKNWELIICDDCSKDSTYDVLMDFQNKDSRIKIIRNETNMRLAASLNRCLALAKGKYIARLDADDEYLPLKLEKQVKFLEQHPTIDVVGTSRLLFDENGIYGSANSMEYPTKYNLLFDAPFAHPTILMKKEVYDRLKGYSVENITQRCEDLDLWFRFYEQNFSGYNIQEPLYKYHLSRTDYKKRSISAAIGTTKVFIRGYKKIGIPKYKYIFALKPIITALIPNQFMYFMHRKRFTKGA